MKKPNDDGYIDLDETPVYIAGKRFTETDCAELVDDIEANPRPIGRPALDHSGQASVQVAFRVAPEMSAALKRVAQDKGVRQADILREALRSYLAKAS